MTKNIEELNTLKKQPLKALASTLLVILTMAGCVREAFVDAPNLGHIALIVQDDDLLTKGSSENEIGSFELEFPGSQSMTVSIIEDLPTRSAPIQTSENPLSKLYLWAKLTDNGDSYIEAERLDGSGPTWKTGHFWPNTRSLSFLACSTSGAELGFSPAISTSGAQLVTSFDYTVKKGSGEYTERDAEVQDDLLFGMAFNRSSGSDVPIEMRHALSAIRFVVGKMPYGIKLGSIALTNICESGHCTVSGEVSDLAFSWSGQSSPVKYSQTFDQDMKEGDPIGGKEKTFMIIPQGFDTEKAELEISFTIEGRPDKLKKPLKSIMGDTKFEAHRRYTFRLGIPDEVDITVDDNVQDGYIKNNVVIQNTGFGPGYVRMALVGNWVNSNNIIVAPWVPEDGVFENWNPDWERRSDGFYYYKKLVLGGAFVPSPFDSYTITTVHHSGQTLLLSVMTQIIHQSVIDNDTANTIWPCHPEYTK